MDEAGEVDGAAIIAGCEAPEMLQAAEASFDLIAVLVEFGFVVGDEDLAVAAWTGSPPWPSSRAISLAQVVAVIGFIGEYSVGLLPFQEIGGGSDIVRLAGRDT